MMVLSTNEAIWDPPVPPPACCERIRGMGFRGITVGVGAGLGEAELARLKMAYAPFDRIAFHAPFGDMAPVEVVTDMATLKSRTETVSSVIQNAWISPSGKRAVFQARGEVFTVPAEFGSSYSTEYGLRAWSSCETLEASPVEWSI